MEKASRNSKPVKYLERKIPSLDATRVAVSYTEAKFGRLFFKPVTVPARIWVSWKGARAWRRMMTDDGSHGDISDATTIKGSFVEGADITGDRIWISSFQRKNKSTHSC